jgi:hypothetical protein
MSASAIVELNRNSWKDGLDKNDWPRSRYSGVAMRPGWMVISIIISRTGGFGHSHIAFEWYADEIPQERIWQRKHEIYHLLPSYTDEEKQRYRERQEELRRSSSVGSTSGIAWLSNILDLTYNSRKGEVRLDCRYDYFPIEEGSSFFRSWLVPFKDGWQARQLARESRANPPNFNLIERDQNKNCAKYAQSIAQIANIDVSSPIEQFFGFQLPIKVPIVESIGWTLVEDEITMWNKRLGQ